MQIERMTRIHPHSSAYLGIAAWGDMHTCIPKHRYSSNYIKNLLDLGMQIDVLTSIPQRTSAYHGIRPLGLYAYVHTIT